MVKKHEWKESDCKMAYDFAKQGLYGTDEAKRMGNKLGMGEHSFNMGIRTFEQLIKGEKPLSVSKLTQSVFDKYHTKI